MKKYELNWTLGYSESIDLSPKEIFPASVPGAAQLDYARANDWPAYEFGTNYLRFQELEDVYWTYRAELNFAVRAEERAVIVFHGIDYKYRIQIDGMILAESEGMFTPVRCDVTAYAGNPHRLEVILFPAPKADDSNTRSQARLSCKPAACYGWDWHPRLISVGLYDKVELIIRHRCHIESMDIRYQLSDSLDVCHLQTEIGITEPAVLHLSLVDGDVTLIEKTEKVDSGRACSNMTLRSPKLWNPVGYGEQPRYQMIAELKDENGKLLDSVSKKVGFRRVRLVMNEGSWAEPSDFPKSRSDAPATLEVNGKRLFAKGSNWVNAHVFPGVLKTEDYCSLVTLVRNANMNFLRIWGGGFVNHEAFYDLCDENGIMVWQEFPLSCNEYPDDDNYLSVLEKESTSIVRRLRTHPCVVLWCGGNELFNNWSGMTEQHHALRLLDKITYTEDRFTPFIMTSPLNGMGHGHYLNYDERRGEDVIAQFVRAGKTAYTEFGSESAAAPEYIKKYISQEDYQNCSKDNPAWVGHHAFLAWYPETHLRFAEAEYFFGGYSDIDDLCEKTRFIQAMCVKSYFEEMRKQWPHCSMALNWCFNEPWPTYANNSLVSWPDIPKPAYYTVRDALRPAIASLRIKRHLWKSGELFEAELWLLNDHLEKLQNIDVQVSYSFGEETAVLWGSIHCPILDAQSARKCGAITFHLKEQWSGKVHISLNVIGHPEMNSEYTYLCRSDSQSLNRGMLNV